MNKRLKIISIIVILPFVIFFWPSSLGGDTTVMMVQGSSMLPTILPGSLVVAKAAPEYGVGDIVAYELREGGASKIIVHRIMEVTDNGFVIQGDNNPKKDIGFPGEDVILGTVLFSTPFVGDLLGMFKNPLVLVVAAAIIFGVQMEQKNRKERKEKRRCIRLGIPYISSKLRKASKKRKKPDYSMFFAAIVFNVVTFILTQISIEDGIKPQGDMITGFLYNGIAPGLANTLIFVFYFGIIFGLYFLAKSYERKARYRRLISYTAGNTTLIQKQKSNPMLMVSSVGWLLFVIMSFFHVMTLVGIGAF